MTNLEYCNEILSIIGNVTEANEAIYNLAFDAYQKLGGKESQPSLATIYNELKSAIQIWDNTGILNLTNNGLYNLLGKPIIVDVSGGSILNDEIWYTTTDGKILTPSSTEGLPTIISNTYIYGKGIIKFNGQVTQLGQDLVGTFDGCTRLQTVIIPDSVIIIKNNTFRNCTNLVNVYIPDGVTEYPQRMLSGCAKLPSFNIPNTVTSIGSFAMSDCPKLEYINIPDSVTYIDDAAFYNTGIKSATISKNITAIPRLLFSTCKELTNIVYNGTKTQWNAIPKGETWHTYVPATVVHCIDGDVAI